MGPVERNCRPNCDAAPVTVSDHANVSKKYAGNSEIRKRKGAFHKCTYGCNTPAEDS